MNMRQPVPVHKTEASGQMTVRIGGGKIVAGVHVRHCQHSAFPASVQPLESASAADHQGVERPRLFPNGLAQCKLLLYGTLVKHYSHTDRPPLLPEHMADVYTTITDLLGENCHALQPGTNLR